MLLLLIMRTFAPMKKRLLHIISYIQKKVRQHPIKSGVALLLLLAYAFCLPRHLFPQPYATVLESAEGKLLSAKIATDGQWRFPEVDSVPYRFKMSVLQFEDAHFYHHWGVNPVSVVKALVRNVKSGRVQRGGSTLTQQVVRIARNHQQRTYAEKLIEMIWATRIEFRYSKESILRLYASPRAFWGKCSGA